MVIVISIGKRMCKLFLLNFPLPLFFFSVVPHTAQGSPVFRAERKMVSAEDLRPEQNPDCGCTGTTGDEVVPPLNLL